MASSYSFDVVCQVDLQEVTNAVDQAKREITNRYDFRGSTAEIDLDKEEPSLQLTAEDEYKLQAVTDILLTKMLKRNVPVKSLVYGKTEPTGKVLKKKISIQQEIIESVTMESLWMGFAANLQFFHKECAGVQVFDQFKSTVR